MEKINIAELLRDCPSGMELDCTMYDNLYFDRVDTFGNIRCYFKHENGTLLNVTFHKNGCYHTFSNSKCVIFPKGKTTWEGFVPPCKFKDGDVISNGYCIAIFYKLGTPDVVYYHCYYNHYNNQKYCKFKAKLDFGIGTYKEFRYATEEEKQKLFDAIKDNGYKWNPETKTLELLIKPEFKDGDIAADEHGNIAIYKGTMWYNKKLADYYCGYRKSDNRFLTKTERDGHFGLIEELHHATEKEKEILFKAIENNGYKWNSEAKSLEKLPIFKTGDRIKHKSSNLYCTLGEYSEGISAYRTNIGLAITYKDMEQWELAPNKFDISTLTPFESRVLVRNVGAWEPAFWGYYSKEYAYPFVVDGGNTFAQCVPYEGNEHLLGTTNDCDDFYKIW